MNSSSPILFQLDDALSGEKWALALAEERRRLFEDQNMMRDREQNLRAYEARLHVLQSEIDASRARHAPALRKEPWPGSNELGMERDLSAGWEKLHRTREILEAEQRNMRDERVAWRDLAAELKRRAEAVAAREADLDAREAQLDETMRSPLPSESASVSVTRFFGWAKA